jgi:hypothetical protein
MSGDDIRTHPKDLSVHSSVLLKDGTTGWGPAFRVSAVHQHRDGSWLWEAMPEWTSGRIEVDDADHEAEPWLCLAARGAWNLWGERPSLIKQSGCSGLSIQVLYGPLTIAAVAVVIEAGRGIYSGWMVEPSLRLSFTRKEQSGARDPEHWLAQVLCLVAFGNFRPPGLRATRADVRDLPPFWRNGQLPSFVAGLGPDALKPEVCGDYLFLSLFEYDD